MSETSSLVDSSSYETWLNYPQTKWYLSKLEERVKNLEEKWSDGQIDPEHLVIESSIAAATKDILIRAKSFDAMVALGELL